MHLVDNSSFDLPDEFLKKWLKFNSQEPKTDEEVEKIYDDAKKGMRYQLIEGKIADKFELNVTQDDVLDQAVKMIKQQMQMYGISNPEMDDNQLKQIAEKLGVNICEGTKVNEVTISNNIFALKYNGGELTAAIVAAGYGKKSNLDVKWNRNFTQKKLNKLNNYIGVKYHIKADFPADTIALHNFENGYCGISKVEGNTWCLCYMTTAKNLQKNGGSIRTMEENILYQNPFLQKIFTQSKFEFSAPVTISQISFDKKSQVGDHILMIGDAAGMVTPLCGNGMSMAMHSAKIAAKLADDFLNQSITRDQMERQYENEWTQTFSSRLKWGRIIQQFFGKSKLTNVFIGIIQRFPRLVNRMIKSTHGKEF